MVSSTTSPSFIGKLGNWVISPSKRVPEIERRDARLITSLAAVLVVALFLRLLFTSTVDAILVGSFVAMIVAYALSRTRYRQISAFIIVMLLLAPIISNLLDTPAGTNYSDWVLGRAVWLTSTLR